MGRPKKKSGGQSGKRVQILPGMTDIIPGSDHFWDFLISKLQKFARGYGYSRVELPILEHAALYDSIDVGDTTIITLVDPEGNKIAIRPDILPGLMRAFADHKMQETEKSLKWYHVSPVLSYDEKHKRFINSWEYGFELFGEFPVLTEVQLISLTWKFLRSIGLENLTIEINSIGRTETRKDYEGALHSYLQSKKYELSNEAVAAIEEDPMNIFRLSDLESQTVASEAPQIMDFLDEESRKHFTHVLEGLDEIGVQYNLNPMLVGKEGASRTVFAVKYKDEQNEYFIGQGSYHDELLKDITGKQTPCFGFIGYMEVLQKALQNLNVEIIRDARAEVFLVPLGDLAAKKALRLFSELWDEKIIVHDSFGDMGVKNQLKMAEASRAPIALIIGQKEAMDEMVILRDVKSGMQEVFQYERIIDEVKKRLGK